MRYRMLERCREAFPIRMMCRCLKVSVSGYYDWRDRPPSARTLDNQRLFRRIAAMHAESDGVLGAPRIWEDLRYAGETCSFNRVARLMRIHQLQGIPQKKRWKKKACEKRPVGVANHLARDFRASVPNTKETLIYSATLTHIEQ